MRRRKYLAAVGSLAAGGAAMIGTGAFSTRNKRGFALDVVGDSSAYLGLAAADSPHVSESGGTLSIDLASETGYSGSGINDDGETLLRPAFTVTNQGSQDLYFEIDNPLSNTDITTSESNPSTATGGEVTVPAGLDVQFLAATSIPPGTLALVGRDNLTASSLGGESFELGSNEFYFPADVQPETNAGGRIPLTETGNGFVGAGAIELTPGESVDVVLRAIANGVSGEVPDVDFTAEAYSETSTLSYDTVSL
jgi:hypothetical protein